MENTYALKMKKIKKQINELKEYFINYFKEYDRLSFVSEKYIKEKLKLKICKLTDSYGQFVLGKNYYSIDLKTISNKNKLIIATFQKVRGNN